MSIPEHSVLPRIPKKLEGLVELALDMRFSWSHEADAIWKRLDDTTWSHTHNPWLVLQTVSERTLKEVATDDAFIQMVDSLVSQEREVVARDRWFQTKHGSGPLRQGVVYLSMEFGISDALPIYSGGLGLLAGDHLKAAANLGIPLVGVGLLYQTGYFRQYLDAEGHQLALTPSNNTTELPIMPVRDQDGELLRFQMQYPGHKVWVRVWVARIGSIRLYLLDTNDPVNHPVDRCITGQLYGGGKEQRLQQEFLLGIGGWKLIRKLGLNPEVCHLNEGHPAFAVLERAREYMEANEVDFHTALSATRVANLFTTHTPVEAGFDRFDIPMIKHYLGEYVRDHLKVDIQDVIRLGQGPSDGSDAPFNMAYLAIHASAAVNGVSKLHGEVSQSIFAPLFPGWPISEIPVGHVTNGVHVASWHSPDTAQLWDQWAGKDRWTGELEGITDSIRKVPDEDLWDLRIANRSRLVSYVRRYFTRQTASTGDRSWEDVERESRLLFDANVLTLGFARRFAPYKRPNLLMHDPERLIRILNNPHRPVQIIIAGKAHPADVMGQQMVRNWVQFMKNPVVRRRAIFIHDYDILLAERMVRGVDVWINNPRRPWEASGTSGMKVLVNGGLNLSALDGWWAEAYAPDVGWKIGDAESCPGDVAACDAREAEDLYNTLEHDVIPAFYDRDHRGIPVRWVGMMRESMARLTPLFSTNRMVRQYTEQYYVPLANGHGRRFHDRGETARNINAWRRQLQKTWVTLHFGNLHVEHQGERYVFWIPVYLGEVDPAGIQVEVFAEGRRAGEGPMRHAMTRDHALAGAANGFMFRAEVPANRPVQEYTVRVVPHHGEAVAPLEACLIRWQK
ncbi:MAG: alpha-glucan family phosphorylase [Magnetococcus sp. WYHC-3]